MMTQQQSRYVRGIGAPSTLAEVWLDQFFDPRQGARSFREVYTKITGDKNITGRYEKCDRARLVESLDTSSWANVLGTSIAKRMVAEYGRDIPSSIWRSLVTIAKDVNNFRTQERVRWGGYGDLPTVAEGSPYAALTSPPDERATYAVTKRGGTETITLEMIKNDDSQAIRLIPKRLAEAADRTLMHFALDFLRSNPTIYDGVPLFHASHGNLGNLALAANGVAAAAYAMQKQTEPGSGDRLGLTPRYLWVPMDLEETGYNIFRRGVNRDRTFVQNMKVDLKMVPYWTDTNDWCMSADPSECPTVEIAFLDGQEEPEIFLQDSPTVGSMFGSDQLTYKIRHIYGGAVVDFRGLYKSVV